MRDIPSMHQILQTFSLPTYKLKKLNCFDTILLLLHCNSKEVSGGKNPIIKDFKSDGAHSQRKFQDIWQDVSSNMFSLKIREGPTSHLKGRYLTPQVLTNRVLILLKADMISRRMQHFPCVLSVIVDICQQWEEVQVNLQWRA